MNKFQAMLSNSSNEVIKQRAKSLSEMAKLEQEGFVNTLKSARMQTIFELDKLNDINPESSVSLRPGENFNAARWVQQNQELQLKIVDLDLQIEIAEKTMKEFFEEQEAPKA